MSTELLHAVVPPIPSPVPGTPAEAPLPPSTVPDAPVPLATLAIRPWPDSVIDALGHDPRSTYVEMFWLGILGPSTTWLLRRMAAGLEASPAGFDLDLADTAAALGLGGRGGRHSPFMRALGRCCQFDLAMVRGDGTLAVRRKVPPLNRRQVLRLAPSLVAAHQAWQEGQLRTPAVEQQRRRARRLALSLLELGEDVDAAERQLLRWKFHPGLCRESAAWAWDRHRRALAGDDAGDEQGGEGAVNEASGAGGGLDQVGVGEVAAGQSSHRPDGSDDRHPAARGPDAA
ncbi:MAG: hypothetical protein QOI56_1012 [Actinomycetota bacterium]|nr:hypothetical protein [Actinomycetota bacterium]